MKINNSVFRTDLHDFFDNIFYTSLTAKQSTPFIVITSKEIRGEWYSGNVLKLPPKTKILKAWSGKWKTDIFSFTVKDMRNWMEENQ